MGAKSTKNGVQGFPVGYTPIYSGSWLLSKIRGYWLMFQDSQVGTKSCGVVLKHSGSSFPYFIGGCRDDTNGSVDEIVQGFIRQNTEPDANTVISKPDTSDPIPETTGWYWIKVEIDLIDLTLTTFKSKTNAPYTDGLDDAGKIDPSEPIVDTYNHAVSGGVALGGDGYSQFGGVSDISGLDITFPHLEVGWYQFDGSDEWQTGIRYIAIFGGDVGSSLIDGVEVINTGIVTNQTTSQGGGGSISVPWDTKAELDALKANVKKPAVVFDNEYAMVRLKGELTRYSLSRNTITYHIEEITRKTLTQLCNINPVAYWSELRYTVDAIIYDHFAIWTANAFQNKLIVTGDKSVYLTKIFPLSKDWFTSNAFDTIISKDPPDVEGGEVIFLYYNDPNQTNEVLGGSNVNTASEDSRIIVNLNYKLWFKNDVVFDDIVLDMIMRFTSLNSSKVRGSLDSNFPRIEIWNNQTSVFDTVYQFTGDIDGDTNVEGSETWFTAGIQSANPGAGKSPIFTKDFDLLEVLSVSKSVFKTNYIDNISAANASNFKSGDIIIRVLSAEMPILTGNDPKIEIHFASLTFNINPVISLKQAQELSTGFIASNTIDALAIDDTKSFSISDWPPADGASAGDDYRITDDLITVLDDISTALVDWTILASFDTDHSGVAIPRDLSYVYLKEFLNKWKSTLNWAYFSRSDDLENILMIRDNFDSTGITLLWTDILGYLNGNFTVVVDSKNLRENVTAIGAEGLISTVNPSVEFESTLGDEDKVYRNKELFSQKNINDFAINKAKLHTDATVNISLSLDFDKLPQDYSPILVGRLIHIKIDEWDSTDTGDNHELFIESAQYIFENDKQKLTIHLMKRVV